MPKPKFDSTLNIGNLIILGIFLLGLFGGYKKIEANVEQLIRKVEAVEQTATPADQFKDLKKKVEAHHKGAPTCKEVDELRRRVEANEMMKTLVARLDERLQAIEDLLREMREDWRNRQQ